MDGGESSQERIKGDDVDSHFDDRWKSSYKDKVMGIASDVAMEGVDPDLDDGVSDDDEEPEEEEDGPYFTMGMTMEERLKLEGRGGLV